MAQTDKLQTIPAADCDVVDAPANVGRDAIQLCMFTPPAFDSPVLTFKRTLEYTQHPTDYLKNILGTEKFGERRPLLCIPDKLDKDVYGSGAHKEHFEQHVANLLSKAHGLFFITGVQAQLVALKIHCDNVGNNRVAWHVTSHLESAEEAAYKHLYGLERILLGKSAQTNPTLDEINEVLTLPATERPAAILIEIPSRSIGCETYEYDELVKISAACRQAGVRLHCDGARIWEIEPYYREKAGKSFKDIGPLFDSVYVSFYKALGGAAGAVLALDDPEIINKAKVWQRRAGGNLFTLAYQIIDDERGFNENIGSFTEKREKMMEIAREVTKATASFANGEGHAIVSFKPEVPTCCQVHTVFEGFTSSELLAARDMVQQKTNIRVFERLRPQKTVDETLEMERAAKLAGAGDHAAAPPSDVKRHFIEWMIVNTTSAIDTKFFVEGYTALCKELLAQ